MHSQAAHTGYTMRGRRSTWTLVSELSFGGALVILGLSFYSWGMDKLTNSPAHRHHKLAIEALAARDYEVAVSEFKEAAALEPTNAAIPYELGLLYRDLGRTSEAIASWRQSLRIDSSMTQASRALKDIAPSGILMPASEEPVSNLLPPEESGAVRSLSLDALRRAQ